MSGAFHDSYFYHPTVKVNCDRVLGHPYVSSFRFSDPYRNRVMKVIYKSLGVGGGIPIRKAFGRFTSRN